MINTLIFKTVFNRLKRYFFFLFIVASQKLPNKKKNMII